MGTTSFDVRALEIHSQNAWDFNWVRKSLDVMADHGMNTLILHRNDLVDLVVYPGAYFGTEREDNRNIFERYQEIFRKLYKYTPTRRSGPFQRRAYLKRVIEEAARRNITVFAQNKELYFPEILLEFHPELVKNGTVCPNEPFWDGFVRTKYTEFFEEFPGIGGIITAPATGESRVSISSSRCSCDLCKRTAPQEWYRRILNAMYEPTRAAGKKMLVRDFVFNAAAHAEIASVMEELPPDVGISLKNTPHDYYPTFPDNPRIGNVGNHDQWIEFDAMGQYFGWGIGMAAMLDDYRSRMTKAREKGAKGIVLRTDWESLDGHSAFQTPNFLNVVAAAALSNDLTCDSSAIYRRWLDEEKLLDPGATESTATECVAWAESLMGRTWEVVRRTLYVNDCVFSDSSTIPVSLEHALWLAEEKNSLKDWDPSKAGAFDTREENLRAIMREKDEALELVGELHAVAQEGHVGLSPMGNRYFADRFGIFSRYVRSFRIVTHVIILTKYLTEHGTDSSTFHREAVSLQAERMQELQKLSREFEAFFKESSFQHTVYTLLDPERLQALIKDVERTLAA